MNDYLNKPLAAEPWQSYRYWGRYGWIMIGAKDDNGALREAKRSTDGNMQLIRLQKWNGVRYVDTLQSSR